MNAALVGLGRWAGAHASAARRSRHIDITTCFSRTPETRSAFAERHEIPSVARSWHEVLDDPEVGLVILSTPNDTHVDMTIEATDAGKIVLVDKPVSVDVSEGLRLMRELPPDATVAVAHHARRLAGHRRQKAWLEDGLAGRARLLQATFSNERGARMHPDAWHRHDRGARAGVLIQVGIHQVDNALWLLGPPLSVGATFHHDTMGATMPDAAALTIHHTSGAISQIASGWATPSHYRLHIQATGGNSEYWLDHRRWTASDVDDSAELWEWPLGGERVRVKPEKGDPLRDQLDDLATGSGAFGPGVTIVEGLRAMVVVDAAVRAAHSGRTVIVRDLLVDAGAEAHEVDTLLGRVDGEG